MPRENRKRGKKHNKKPQDDVHIHHEPYARELEFEPSWIVSAPDPAEVDREAPFGYVDAEVKAYFRTVDLQIRDWQEEGHGAVGGEEDVDPNEDRHLFFVAALTEMSDKEKQLATDPDCSGILERMTYSMDDFVRRVFVDKLSGSFELLFKHRFASHVCQTMLTVASDTISRESRGIIPTPPETSEGGELRTLTQLIAEICEELLPTFSSLVMDPFASHVVRALLILLAPDCLSSNEGSAHVSGAVRSKKSAAYKARQGPMKSVFSESQGDATKDISKRIPKEFRVLALQFVLALRDQLGESEVRALAANQVASPVLQMLLEVESGYGMADKPDSLMDRALVGLISLSHEDPSTAPESSDYIATLLRDPTASHLLETLIKRSPTSVFGMLWATYLKGKLSKLVVHPVANFVVAKALDRASTEQLGEVCDELARVWGKIVKTARTGVLRALVDRAAALNACELQILEAIYTAFELTSPEDKQLLVQCVLRIKTVHDFKAARVSNETESADVIPRKRVRTEASTDPLEPTTQGAVLLQAILRLSAPYNQSVLGSLQAMGIDELLSMSHHITSSRVLDAVFDAPSVPSKSKRTLVLAFLGYYHTLVDDRIGSRVGDRCWAYADPYLKEKVARSLVPHEHFLAGSFYGKFFARHLNLHLLQRDPEKWKTIQSSAKTAVSSAPQYTAASSSAVANPVSASVEQVSGVARPKKRKARPQDEIDELFDTAPGKKSKSADGEQDNAADPERRKTLEKPKKLPVTQSEDRNLQEVMGAIRAAPKDEKKHRKKRES